MRLLSLSGGKAVTLVDDDVWAWAKEASWYVRNGRHTSYAYNPNHPTPEMRHLHRMILGALEESVVIDHRNGHGLDNRKINLRPCTNQQNKQARTHRHGKFASKFRGVQRDKVRNKWVAQIRIGTVAKTLGRFKTEEEAARCYDAAAERSFGEFAQLNFGHPHKKLFYLATPYSAPTPELRRQRFRQVTAVAALLSKAGLTVFSPITSSHCLAEGHNLPGSWAFWKRIDFDFLRCSQCLVVLQLPGWETSVGVTAEIAFAKEKGIQIEYLDPQYLSVADL